MSKYIIIDAEAIQKRIEELKKPIAHYDGIYVSERQIAEYESLEEILSQSTPLIPEIEKAFDAGYDLNTWEQLEIPNEERDYLNTQDYISNLKLDI